MGELSFHVCTCRSVSISPALRLEFTALSWRGDLSLGLGGRAGGRPAAAATFSGSCCKRTLREGSATSLRLPLSLHPEPSSPFCRGSIPASAATGAVFSADQWEAAERPSASAHVVWSLARRRARSCTAASCAWRTGARRGAGGH